MPLFGSSATWINLDAVADGGARGGGSNTNDEHSSTIANLSKSIVFFRRHLRCQW